MDKDTRNQILIAIVTIAALFLLFGGGNKGFLASVLTLCTNQEPTSMSAELDNLANLNKTVYSPESLILPLTTNITKAYQSYRTNAYENAIIIDLGNVSCQKIFNDLKNNSTITTYRFHDIINKNGTIYWCNKENNILYKSSSTNSPTIYYSTYEVCRSQEYKEVAYELDPDRCIEAGGSWSAEKCICYDGTQLQINAICPTPPREETPPEITPITPVTTPPTTSNTNRIITFIILGAGIIVIVFFLVRGLKGRKKK